MILGRPPAAPKSYDYLLKVLLVGDSDVGKQEILQDLEDGSADSPFCSGSGNCSLVIIYSLNYYINKCSKKPNDVINFNFNVSQSV